MSCAWSCAASLRRVASVFMEEALKHKGESRAFELFFPSLFPFPFYQFNVRDHEQLREFGGIPSCDCDPLERLLLVVGWSVCTGGSTAMCCKKKKACHYSLIFQPVPVGATFPWIMSLGVGSSRAAPAALLLSSLLQVGLLSNSARGLQLSKLTRLRCLQRQL